MNHINSTPKDFNVKTFPFTDAHFTKFRNELIEAGSFDVLMIKKKALSGKLGMKYIPLYSNIEKYQKKFLTGEYESLRPFYDTEMPYVFWSVMYETLLKSEKQTA